MKPGWPVAQRLGSQAPWGSFFVPVIQEQNPALLGENPLPWLVFPFCDFGVYTLYGSGRRKSGYPVIFKWRTQRKGSQACGKVWKVWFIQVLGIFMTNIFWQQLYIHCFFFLLCVFIKCFRKGLPGTVLSTHELWPFLLWIVSATADQCKILKGCRNGVFSPQEKSVVCFSLKNGILSLSSCSTLFSS